MRIALITETPVNTTHGTGCLLLRLFSGSGFTVVNLHPESDPGTDARLQEVSVRQKRNLPKRILDATRRRVRRLHSALAQVVAAPVVAEEYDVTDDVKAAVRHSDLVLGVVYSWFGLRFLQACLDSLPQVPPVTLWFMDCGLGHEPVTPALEQFLRRLSPRIWVFNAEIKRALQKALPWASEQIEIRFHLGIELPAPAKQVAAPGDVCKCVLIGTFWDASMAALLRDIWQQTRRENSRCGPLQWYAAPLAMQVLQKRGITLEPDIAYKGYAAPADFAREQQSAIQLDSILRAADVAVMPFSTAADPLSDYARYSFPSRLADYCAYGLPIFALAHPESNVSRFIRENEIGIVHDASSVTGAAEALSRYLADSSLRVTHGRNARALAERIFDIREVRQEFAADLRGVVPTLAGA